MTSVFGYYNLRVFASECVSALTANFPRYFAFLISFQSHDARKASLCKVSIDINPF